MNYQDVKSLLTNPSYEVAPYLIGSRLSHLTERGLIEGIITEVEAYEQDDPASHSYGGESERNRAMFGPSGHAYVYLSYGIHWCLNIVTDQEGYGSGVLVRGVHIVSGADLAANSRFGVPSVGDLSRYQLKNLSNGPGKVTQALGVDIGMYGIDLLDSKSPFKLTIADKVPDTYISTTPRIGISKAVDRRWRWLLSGDYLNKVIVSE